MPQNYDTVKVGNSRQKKYKANVIEWDTWEYYRGVKDIPVKIIDMASQTKPRKKVDSWPRAEGSAALQSETAPQSMDIDDAFWVEEPAMPTSEKRVRQHACPLLTKLTYLPVPGHLH